MDKKEKFLFGVCLRVFCGLLLCSGMMTAQSITVTAPAAGTTWCKGQVYVITWTKTGVMDANIKIRLYDSTGTVSVHAMTDSAPNSGSYSWTVPTTISPGAYLVRVKTVDNAVFDNSEPFTIADCPAGSITISMPMETGAYSQGYGMEIIWSVTGLTGNGRLEMVPEGGGPVHLIRDGYALSGSPLDYTIPETVPPGMYRVRISQGTVSALSGRFGVVAYTPPGLRVTSPNGGETFIQGSRGSITWQAPNIEGNIRIQLLHRDTPIATLAESHRANAGYFNWGPIPASFEGRKYLLGDTYKIRISTPDGRYHDDSDSTFSLRAPAGIWVSSPRGTDSWPVGADREIRWKAQYLEGFRADILLLLPRPGQPTPDRYRIAAGIDPMSGTYAWRVGRHLEGELRLAEGSYPGCKIMIHASTSGSQRSGESPAFTLVVPRTLRKR